MNYGMLVIFIDHWTGERGYMIQYLPIKLKVLISAARICDAGQIIPNNDQFDDVIPSAAAS